MASAIVTRKAEAGAPRNRENAASPPLSAGPRTPGAEPRHDHILQSGRDPTTARGRGGKSVAAALSARRPPAAPDEAAATTPAATPPARHDESEPAPPIRA